MNQAKSMYHRISLFDFLKRINFDKGVYMLHLPVGVNLIIS